MVRQAIRYLNPVVAPCPQIGCVCKRRRGGNQRQQKQQQSGSRQKCLFQRHRVAFHDILACVCDHRECASRYRFVSPPDCADTHTLYESMWPQIAVDPERRSAEKLSDPTTYMVDSSSSPRRKESFIPRHVETIASRFTRAT